MGINPFYEQGGITIFHGDCLEVLPTFRSTFRRDRELLSFSDAMKLVARLREEAQLQTPLGGLLLPIEA